ncbi:VOC family protein [Legionella impletisoli]|uniref:Glyoxalase n=1 Tax=Legionella impletisoli TaxID=343510 RepID=A0A917N9Z3_9GAMM|nr:VOC family protein [Legionella impletisoli]GGI81905.1 glyoxalase [Legionella impletisoli]
MQTLFHLAFPVHDFEKAKAFYHEKLGCDIGRESKNALIFKFGTHQIVAHKIDLPLPEQSSIYPRHFGLIFTEEAQFKNFIHQLTARQVEFESPLKTRFKNTRIEHQSFFLKDPSNNLLEFKFYTHPSAIFAETEFTCVGESND